MLAGLLGVTERSASIMKLWRMYRLKRKTVRLRRFARQSLTTKINFAHRGRNWFGCLVMGTALVMAAPTVSASPTLKLNSRGPDVLILQQKLKLIGYEISEIDGVFGSETEKAVIQFQKDSQISGTGVVNNATWRALKGLKEELSEKDIASIKTTDIASLKEKKVVNLKINVPFHKQILPKNKVKDVIGTAKKYMGVPYVFGGTTPKGFDCSGFLQFVFAKQGMNIPRLADDQYKLGVSVKNAKSLVPGDLVFFTTYTAGPSHCGIYLGKGDFIHTSSSKGVRVDNLSNDYWKPRFIGGKHIVI